jgi:monoamine oxidase
MTKHDFDTIVIGGGFAGVTACRDLAEQGYSVLLLEARDRLGGRTWSEHKKIGDWEGTVEFGGQWVYPDQQVNMMAEIERYGLTLKHSPTPLNYPTLRNGVHNPGPLPVPLEDVFDLEKAVHQVISDSHRIELGIPLDKQRLDDLDIPFSEYLDNLGVSDAARAFVASFGNFFTGRYQDEVSALPPLQFIAQMGHSFIRAWGVIDEYLAEGTATLITAIADDSGADIRLSTPVDRVEQSDSGVLVTTRSGETFSAGTVVVATPMACWRNIEFNPPLSDHKDAATRENHVAYGVKVWAQVRGATPLPYTLPDPETSHGAALMFTQAEMEGDDQLMVGFFLQHPERESFGTDFQGVERFVKTLYPGADLIDYDIHPFVDEEWTGEGDWIAYKPGRISKSHSELSKPEGRLHFATADIAHTFLAWMDGAVEMGKKAAVDAQRLMTRDAIESKVPARAKASSVTSASAQA